MFPLHAEPEAVMTGITGADCPAGNTRLCNPTLLYSFVSSTSSIPSAFAIILYVPAEMEHGTVNCLLTIPVLPNEFNVDISYEPSKRSPLLPGVRLLSAE